ncbi:MAG TPA: hypothetical protein PLQ89_09965 [Phycisphaerae bacterium]|nr:hypothetical protein [Phycisphaerae bacterium]
MKSRGTSVLLCSAVLAVSGMAAAEPFTPGNLVVLMADGTVDPQWQAYSDSAGPVYLVEYTTILPCVGDECLGACCHADGTCSDNVPESACDGVWGGVASTCENRNCLGACCHGDGTCTDNAPRSRPHAVTRVGRYGAGDQLAQT